MVRQGKQSFFEKKDQKTFVPGAADQGIVLFSDECAWIRIARCGLRFFGRPGLIQAVLDQASLELPAAVWVIRAPAGAARPFHNAAGKRNGQRQQHNSRYGTYHGLILWTAENYTSPQRRPAIEVSVTIGNAGHGLRPAAFYAGICAALRHSLTARLQEWPEPHDVTPGTQIILSFTLTCGVPLVLAMRDLIALRRPSAGGGWSPEPPPPEPPAPNRSGPAQLPACLLEAAKGDARYRTLERV